MSLDAILTLILLAGTLAVMATQVLRPDITALLVMLILAVSGILPTTTIFGSFGDPVIIVVAGIYVLGAGLFETGVANIIAARLGGVGGRGELALLLVVLLVAAAMSAFLMSMLVVAVLMPAVLRIARQAAIAPGRLLLPLATGATLGNQLSLVGTTSNLVISDLLAGSGAGPLRMFTLTPFALASVAAAVVWFALAGRRLLPAELPAEPQRPSLEEIARNYGLQSQLYRLRVRSVSSLIGQRLDQSRLSSRFELQIVAVRPRLSGRLTPSRPDMILEHDDIVIVQGKHGDVLQAAGQLGLELKQSAGLSDLAGLDSQAPRLAEVVVPLRSPLEGKTLAESDFRERTGLAVLAVHRQGESIHGQLAKVNLSPGDTLLVEGTMGQLRRVKRDGLLVLTTDLGPQPGDVVTGQARLAMAILGGFVLVTVTGLLPLVTASLAAALALVLTGCISPDRAYRSIDVRVLVVIAGMLPLSQALVETGAAAFLADLLAGFSRLAGPPAGLVLLYILTVLITQVISNTVTAALVTPIAISLATVQGLSPLPFAIAIAFAVNAAYITPLTDGNNLLVREPGRYSMRDFVINGLPLSALQMLMVFALLAFLA